MDPLYSIAWNIETIQKIFLEAKAFAEKEKDVDEIVAYLENISGRFLSIAYEGVSMGLALKILSEDHPLDSWSEFLHKYAQKHSVQFHIGLGWAFAQKRKSPENYLHKMTPLSRWRVLDGYGYYEGLFRRRKPFQHLLSNKFKENELKAYSFGLGRSLWYRCKGNIDSLLSLIKDLPIYQQKDLWRGVGVASSYVGGGDDVLWQSLWIAAAEFQPQLAAGSAMCLWSVNNAKILFNSGFCLACQWSGLKEHELINIMKKKETTLNLKSENVYFLWVNIIDEMFVELLKPVD